jgi:hypothetical protein
MAIAAEPSILQIGETAGAIWRALSKHGPLSAAKLVKAVDAPRDLTMQAIGWLAREDKIVIDDSRSRVITLRQS